jgi:hypothetical protein
MMIMMNTRISTITLITISQKVMLNLKTSTMRRISTRMKIKTFTNISFISLLLLGSLKRFGRLPECEAHLNSGSDPSESTPNTVELGCIFRRLRLCVWLGQEDAVAGSEDQPFPLKIMKLRITRGGQRI